MKLNWHDSDITRGRTVVTTLDVHAAGEPLRIITGGLGDLPGQTMLARRRWLR